VQTGYGAKKGIMLKAIQVDLLINNTIYIR
jgi:hypothetical protein